MLEAFQFAHWVSQEAIDEFRLLSSLPAAPSSKDTEAIRAHYDEFNQRHLSEALDEFDVVITNTFVGDVLVHMVERPNIEPGPTLICLHGGSFMWGRGAGALLEAVPIAATTGFRVAAVEYALAPESQYPSAIDDVIAVYGSLLEQLPARSIGIFGCSAGGMLTSQVVARLISEGLPVPGAIAMICGTGIEIDGDAPQFSVALSGRTDSIGGFQLSTLPYFDGINPKDSLVFPGEDPELLAQFPPSLLITGSRDFAAGSVSTMHRRLVTAGAEANLFHFDGMWHAFHMATKLPEAREVFELLSHFFHKHLA